MELVSGATIAQFTLIECIAEGGTSTVWSANHLSRGHKVAVKFLSPEIAKSDPSWNQRLTREANIGTRIGSRNVVEIYENGKTPTGTPYIVMELLDGIDLARAVMTTGALTLHETAAIMDQVAGVLEHAHALGIVHRDIKPDNIFLTAATGVFVKVLDFGIAKLTPTALGQRRESEGPITTTQAGVVIGTPEFMSPEQSVSSKDVDFRSDLFSLGMLTYYAVTAELPFAIGDCDAIWRRVEKGPAPVRRKRPDLPDVLDAWFRKALALQPSDRFPSAKAMAESFGKLVAPFVSADEAPVSRFLGGELPAAPLPAMGVRSRRPSQSLEGSARDSMAEPLEEHRVSSGTASAAASTSLDNPADVARPSHSFPADPSDAPLSSLAPLPVTMASLDVGVGATTPTVLTAQVPSMGSTTRAVERPKEQRVPLALWLALLLATATATAGLFFLH